MASYQKYTLEDGTLIYIEIIDSPKSSGGLLPATKTEIVSDQTPISFEKSFDAVKKMAVVMVEKLKEGTDSGLEDVNISFGLKASQDLSTLIVSRGGPDANYNISLHWRNGKKEE